MFPRIPPSLPNDIPPPTFMQQVLYGKNGHFIIVLARTIMVFKIYAFFIIIQQHQQKRIAANFYHTTTANQVCARKCERMRAGKKLSERRAFAPRIFLLGETGIKRCYLKKCVWRRIKNKVRNRLVRCLRPGFKGFLRHCSPVSLLLSRSVRPFCWWLCPPKKKNASLQRSRMVAAKRTLKQANNVWRNRVGSFRGRILVFSVRKVFSSPAPSSRPKRSKLAPLLRESSFYSSVPPFPPSALLSRRGT